MIAGWFSETAKRRALEAELRARSILTDTSRGRYGSDEAKIHALARDLVERRGGEQASRLADLLVSHVQAVRRGL